MISFDNGPANGDYVRYIDDLMQRAAIAASAGVLSTTDTGSGPLDRTRERLAAIASQGSRQPVVVPESRQTTGFAAPVVATPAATAAAAIASALMSGQTSRRSALPMRTQLALIALVGGIVLLLVGLFSAFNIVLIAGSLSLIVAAFRALLRGPDRTKGTSS